MKNNIYILIGLCVFFAQGVHSQVVSKETALRVAKNFLQMQSPLKSQLNIEVYIYGDRNLPTMYVFSTSNSWVLIAGDKRVQPILAYSHENRNEYPIGEDMPPAMVELLEWYSEQISALRHDDNINRYHPQWNAYLELDSLHIPTRSVVVNPLLFRNGHENMWKQRDTNNGTEITRSYNKFCPAVHNLNQDCEHATAGCVAVATAQIMWYWEWPYVAIVRDDNSSFLLRHYDWDFMPYQLLNESNIEEANMIANLLHDVGVAVNMTYECPGHSSTAPSANIPNVLNNFFGYYADSLIRRQNYSDSIWIGMIKNELNALRPIAYAGFYSEGGHQFVIDGYNSDDMFHINFGWASSSANGFYYLNNIYYNYYNLRQTMVINIQPNYPECSPISIPTYDIWSSNFIVQNGGAITIEDRTIASGMHGTIFSGESVTLANGFKIEEGAEVYIDIRDMHCDDERNFFPSFDSSIRNIRHAPQQQQVSSSARKILRNNQILILRGEKTYTLTGQEVK